MVKIENEQSGSFHIKLLKLKLYAREGVFYIHILMQRY